MQIKKFVATGLAALMAGATLAGAALAATQLGNVLNTIGQQAVSGTPYLVVVGSKAAPSDVVGAIDVASALAQQMYTKETIQGTTTISIQGKESTSLHFGDSLQKEFGTELTKTQIPFLLREKLSYNGTDYYVEEKIAVPDAPIETTASTLNGTVYINFESNVPEYKYVFDDDVSTPAFGSNDAYSHPLMVKIMGQPYYIIDTPANNQITVMSGTVGMADASTPVSYNGYSVYVTDGADGSWAKIQIKDSNGNVVKTDIVNQGETADYSSDLGFKVKILNVWASTVSNTVTGKIVVGSELDKTITSGDDFTDYWKWDIYIQNPGSITKGDYIGVVYAPNDTDTKYLPLGSTLKAPGDYFEIGYPKNVIDQFVKLTIEPSTATIYDSATSTSATLSSQPALIITADYPIFGNGEYSKVAIVVNSTSNNNTVYVANYDESASKYVIASSNKFAVTPGNETVSESGTFDKTSISFSFKNGTLEFDISKTGYATPDKIIANYIYDQDNTRFSLGTKGDAEDTDLSVGGSWSDSSVDGTWDHNAFSPYGVVLYNPKDNADNDKVVFEVPADQQTADIYIGKATTTTTEGTTYNKIVPLTTTVAKLDTEVTDADKTNDNLVLVGGPCANSLVEELANAGKFPYTCDSWPKSERFALIKAIDNAFSSGKLALVVAGTYAEDTRLGTSVLALGKLAGQTASSVKVTGTTVSPVITPA